MQVDGTATKERIDTDKNMLTMFNILRKNRRVRLEHLVLNRNSFAQTVENLFTLSFLVKDGRAEIKVDEKGVHLVCKILCKPFFHLCHKFFSFLLFFNHLHTTFSHFQHQRMLLLPMLLPLRWFLTNTLSSDLTSRIGRYLEPKNKKKKIAMCSKMRLRFYYVSTVFFLIGGLSWYFMYPTYMFSFFEQHIIPS